MVHCEGIGDAVPLRRRRVELPQPGGLGLERRARSAGRPSHLDQLGQVCRVARAREGWRAAGSEFGGRGQRERRGGGERAEARRSRGRTRRRLPLSSRSQECVGRRRSVEAVAGAPGHDLCAHRRAPGFSEGDGLVARIVVFESGQRARQRSVERGLLRRKRNKESRVGSGRGSRLGGSLRVTRRIDVNRRVPPLDPVDRVKGRGRDHARQPVRGGRRDVCCGEAGEHGLVPFDRHVRMDLARGERWRHCSRG